MNETTPLNEILESYRAIRVAAVDRRAALVREIAELDAAFPGIGESGETGAETRGRRASNWSEAQRAAHSQRMRDRWASARANGQATLDPQSIAS